MLPILPLITLLAKVAPMLTSSSAVAAAVDAAVALAPVVIETAPALVKQMKSIFETLRGNSLVTKEQLDALDAAEKIIDDNYDKALARAEAEDAAALADKPKSS